MTKNTIDNTVITGLSNEEIAEFKGGERASIGGDFSRRVGNQQRALAREHLERQRESDIIEVPRHLLEAVLYSKAGSHARAEAIGALGEFVEYRSPQERSGRS